MSESSAIANAHKALGPAWAIVNHITIMRSLGPKRCDVHWDRETGDFDAVCINGEHTHHHALAYIDLGALNKFFD